MKDLTQERYVFWRFATQDFYDCSATLKLINETTNKRIKASLFKYAVIAYCRPFSGNEAMYKEQSWTIDINWVDNLELHNELIELRSKLFAHKDIPYLKPTLGNVGDMYPISMKGVYYDQYIAMVEPLLALSNSMLETVKEKANNYKKQFFESN